MKQNAVNEQQWATQKALVDQTVGIVKTDQGVINGDKLNLVYCRITASIDGRIGLRLVDPGNIVHATDTNPLLVITQIQPISAIFTVAEDDLGRILRKMAAGQHLQVDAYERDGFNTKVGTGTLETVDNQIDPTTGSLRLRANFDNANKQLFPNQFVNLRLLLEEKTGVVLINSAAIQRYNNIFVWVVKDDKTVTARNVTLGITEGDNTEITSGLEGGDVVVMTGVDKLTEGVPVTVAMADQNGSGKSGREEEVSPSRTFILRPVATSLLMVGILLAGAVAYKQLPVSALPEVDYPTIQVLTFYPGASPDVMASSVTAPLERQFGQVPGLQQMTSTSSDGSSVITLQFNLSLNIDVAEQEVQQSINAAGTFLPADLPMPPIYSQDQPRRHADPDAGAHFQDGCRCRSVEDLADTRLAPKISQLPGVGLVSISGGQKPAVRIQANPTVLASYGLNLEDLRSAIVAANVNQAKGNFDGAHQAYQIGANDQLLSADDYKPLIVAYRNGAPVKLSRRGGRDRRRRKRSPGGLDERNAGGDHEHPAAAGRQHHPGGGPHQDSCCRS